MGGPLSAILADIDMIRSKNEAVRRLNPSFYKRSVDDIILNAIKMLQMYCLKT